MQQCGFHRLQTFSVIGHWLLLRVRYESWKTYILSYYDSVLREVDKLVTTKWKTEDHRYRYCEIFFSGINQMISEYSRQINQWQC